TYGEGGAEYDRREHEGVVSSRTPLPIVRVAALVAVGAMAAARHRAGRHRERAGLALPLRGGLPAGLGLAVGGVGTDRPQSRGLVAQGVAAGAGEAEGVAGIEVGASDPVVLAHEDLPGSCLGDPEEAGKRDQKTCRRVASEGRKGWHDERL